MNYYETQTSISLELTFFLILKLDASIFENSWHPLPWFLEWLEYSGSYRVMNLL